MISVNPAEISDSEYNLGCEVIFKAIERLKKDSAYLAGYEQWLKTPEGIEASKKDGRRLNGKHDVSVKSPPNEVTISGISLPYSSSIRQTPKSRSWEKYSFAGISLFLISQSFSTMYHTNCSAESCGKNLPTRRFLS